MKPKKLTVILAIIGLITIFAGFTIGQQDVGSCPLNSTGCYYTFSGTNVYISPFANGIMETGAIILAGALIVGLVGHFRKRTNP